MASKMCQLSEENRVQCSEISAILLEQQAPDLPVRPRGLMNIKGKGEGWTFFVNEGEDIGQPDLAKW